MEFKLQPIEIDDSDPFSSDKLDRHFEIANLTQLIENLNTPSVLAINSGWGSGKTTFIRLWERYLAGRQATSFYFNAWETDFCDDPLVAFLGEMDDGLSELINSSGDTRETWEQAKVWGKIIARRGIPALVRIATAGVVDGDSLVEDELQAVFGNIATDAIEDFTKQKDAIAEFHQKLEAFIEKNPDSKPIIVFVDELDRCKPTYAIALLEKIKHLFNVRGLIFILALDKTQLGYAIKAVYGNNFDPDGYLRKFIDFEYQLKKPDLQNFIANIYSRLSLEEFFTKRAEIHNNFRYEGEHFYNSIEKISQDGDLKLREIEHFVASANLALRTVQPTEYAHPELIAYLTYLKHFHEPMLRDLKDSSDLSESQLDFLHKLFGKENYRKIFECAVIEGLLISAKGGKSSPLAKKHREIDREETGTPDEQQYSATAWNVIVNHRSLDLERLLEKINFTSQFLIDGG